MASLMDGATGPHVALQYHFVAIARRQPRRLVRGEGCDLVVNGPLMAGPVHQSRFEDELRGVGPFDGCGIGHHSLL